MLSCSIEQDGNSVPILTVEIETTAEKDEEGTMTPLSVKCGFCRSPPPQKESLLLTVITMAFTPPQSQTLCKLMLHTMFRGWQQYSRTKRYCGGNKMSTVRCDCTIIGKEFILAFSSLYSYLSLRLLIFCFSADISQPKSYAKIHEHR